MGRKRSPLRFLADIWRAWANTMLGQLSLIVAILVFVGTSVITVLSETQWQRIGSGLAAILALFVAVYKVWDKEVENSDALDEKLKPKLKCSFDNSQGCQHRTRLKTKNARTGEVLQSKEVRYFRVRIETTGITSVPGCSGYLLSLKRDGVTLFEGHSLALTIAPAESSPPTVKEIRDQIPSYLDVFYIGQDNKVWITTPQFIYPIAIFPDTLFTGPGEYRFHIVVAAPNVASVPIDVILNWTGDWDTARAYAA